MHKTIISIRRFLKITILRSMTHNGASAKMPPMNGRAGEVYHIFLNIGAPSPKYSTNQKKDRIRADKAVLS